MSTFSHDAVRILGSHKETIDGALYCEYQELKTISGFWDNEVSIQGKNTPWLMGKMNQVVTP